MSNYLKAKRPAAGASDGASAPTTQFLDVLVDASGRLCVASPSYGLEARVGDDAASGGPYYLLTDTSGQLMLGSDGASSYVLFTDNSGRAEVVCTGVDSLAANYRMLVDTDGRLILANHTTATRSNRVEEIDPLDQKYIAETVATVTNATDATYDYYIDMAGYSKLGLQLALDCDAGTVTVTVEMTIQDDGTDPGSCTYQDVTMDLFGVASLISAAAPASDMWIDDTGALGLAKYVHIKVVAATGGNTGDWVIYSKRMF